MQGVFRVQKDYRHQSREFLPTHTYTIYDADKWPHPKGEGGLEVRCGSDYIADYSVLSKSEIGPYDVHEMLHVYQNEIGALPYAHIFFGSAMAEARKQVGDRRGYLDAMTQIKGGMAMTRTAFQKGTFPKEDECLTAELYIESSLYVETPNNVKQFYRKLEQSRERDMADRQKRFNRMFDVVSGGKAKPYLLSHCPGF